MDVKTLEESILKYKEQLKQIDVALLQSIGVEKNDLVSLKSDIEQLIELTEENLNQIKEHEKPSTSNNALDDEYLLFMQEMASEGVQSNLKEKQEEEQRKALEEDLKSVEGMKCQAPHTHTWGETVCHNALVVAVVQNCDTQNFDDIHVRVMFTNPTHLEMLPCPYFLEDSNCKFSDEQCKYSHGQIVPFSSLQEYKEPNFENLKVGHKVLAKNSDKLWHRAIIKKIQEDSILVKYETSNKELSVPLMNVLPLEESDESCSDTSDSENITDTEDTEWMVQKSLLTNPTSQALGDWEKHTRGIGSKLMQQMGYIVGTGLGRHGEGRIEPVEAMVLPNGKSLDHCMQLKELAGGDTNLFSAEKKLKKQQKRHEALSKQQYEREKKKKDVFQFLNQTLSLSKNSSKSDAEKNKEELKTGSVRELNVTSLKIEEDIKRVQFELVKIKQSLIRHNTASVMNTNLKRQLANKQAELNRLNDYAQNVKIEQNLRKDKKKLVVF